jgi:hypothetical protein
MIKILLITITGTISLLIKSIYMLYQIIYMITQRKEGEAGLAMAIINFIYFLITELFTFFIIQLSLN